MTHAWFDISAGVAGDMLLGALVDAGADVAALQAALDAVVPGSVRLETEQVTRGGQRATKAEVRVLVADPPHRTWASIRTLLGASALADLTRASALAVFERLAAAEARAHGIDEQDVHFHEVGALDSIADIVATCEALRLAGVTSVSASPLAVGSGRVRMDHGEVGVPVPAVAELSVGWTLASSPATGELATPTGVALVRALAQRCEGIPPLSVTAAGIGAGTADFPTHPNVVRVVLGTPVGAGVTPSGDTLTEVMANIDDLDPRLWPGVLDACLAAGAADAWLVPIHMKKGRPAFTLHALVATEPKAAVIDTVLSHTTTLGVREVLTHRAVLDRSFVTLAVEGEPLVVKVGSRGGSIVHAAAEFSSVALIATALGRAEADVAQRAAAAIVGAGLVPGARLPGVETPA